MPNREVGFLADENSVRSQAGYAANLLIQVRHEKREKCVFTNFKNLEIPHVITKQEPVFVQKREAAIARVVDFVAAEDL